MKTTKKEEFRIFRVKLLIFLLIFSSIIVYFSFFRYNIEFSNIQIYDTNGKPFKIAGINWFGLETSNYAPHGLWSRNYKEMMDQILQLGYNTIRLPYSNDIFDNSKIPNGIDFYKNSDLNNLTPLQIMDKIIFYAEKIGLKIFLDRHRPDSSSQSELWYSNSCSEQKWIDDWKFLANRYKTYNCLIGADLHNEPHGSVCWGCNDIKLDWKIAATKAGNEILSICPHWYIIVEGIQTYDNNWYWWGGNLRGVRNHPIELSIPNRIIYSTHDYPSSVSSQQWFYTSDYPNNLEKIWDDNWGFIQKENIAPVLIGEFGTKLETDSDKLWFSNLINYIGKNKFHWTFWCWNPNSGDTNGLLLDDWNTIHTQKHNELKKIQINSTFIFPTSTSSQFNPSSYFTPHHSNTPFQSSNSPSIFSSSIIMSNGNQDTFNLIQLKYFSYFLYTIIVIVLFSILIISIKFFSSNEYSSDGFINQTIL